jgi:flagellar assembly protein FliH
MKPWPETITLPQPLRDARLAAAVTPPPSGTPDPALRESYDRGRIDGEKQLSGQLLQQRNELHELLHGVLNSLRQSVPQVVRDTEGLMVSLALEVAQKLVADMPVSVPMVEAMVRDALAQVEGTAQFTVRLNPADLELLQKAGSPLLSESDKPDEFRFLGSPDVTRGGCLVQTRFGTVDARRETKFDLLKRSLTA